MALSTPVKQSKVVALQRLNQQHHHLNQLLVNNNTPTAPLVVENSRYEEWMKIATDNKITSTNTWNLALIDYFHDMTLLRNSDTDHSINFQKASCTLDGCVKIWTSRVDSVATATGKLLSGLAEDENPGRRFDDEDDEDGNGESGDEGAKKAKKNARPHPPSLATSFAKLKFKSLDQEFTVDPLFKKTSADFDEGGAGGILMNHLGCDESMKVVFDAGDARLVDDEEDLGGVENDDDEKDLQKVEVGRLIKNFLPANFLSTTSLPSSFTLCPSLSSFHFSSSNNLDLDIFNLSLDHANADSDSNSNENPSHPSENEDDVWAGNDFGGGGSDNGGGGDDFFADLGADTALNGPATPAEFFGSADGGEGGEAEGLVVDGGEGEGEGDGLEARLFGRNWAGPEHWKMRRVATKAVAKDDGAATTTARQRKEKQAFLLDFTIPATTTSKELFASGTTASISLPSTETASGNGKRKSSMSSNKSGGKKKSNKVEMGFMLPQDCGFGPERLLRLFLKPRTVLKLKRKNVRVSGGGNGGRQGDEMSYVIDGVEGLGPMGMGGGGMNMDMDDDDDMGGMGEYDVPAPFQTQWLQDGDDDTPLGELLEDDEDDGGLAETIGQKPLRVRPDHVKYEKRAKRVDVKKLKDTIWKELEVVSIPVKEFPTIATYIPSSPSSPTTQKPSQQESFIPVLSSLRSTYTPEKMSEISTSFCFICLLHLANEKGLRIQTPLLDEDESAKRRTVGGLDGLRVFREVK